MSRLGDEVARMRLAKGLSQKQLAKQAGVAEAYIQEVEAGKRVMNDQLATRISKLLGGHFGTEAPDMPDAPPTRPPVRLVATHSPASTARPAGQVVYSTEAAGVEGKNSAADNRIWAEAFGQMLREVPVYDPLMNHQTANRTMAVIAGKIEGQPKDKVFWVEVADNDMIGYRIQRTDIVFGITTSTLVEDGFYFIEWNGQRAIRQIKVLPGGMVQVSCHKGAPVRETLAANLVKVLGRMLRVEVRLP
jgi:transcriptional regulator with XRE-family HTH domain